MKKRISHFLLESLVFVATMGPVEIAFSATATVVLTLTIPQPPLQKDSLTLSSSEVDMRGKPSGEITISNHSSAWREIRVALTIQHGEAEGCRLLYSPMNASIPPRGTQLVRLLMTTDGGKSCSMEHRLIIADQHDQLLPIFDVPIYSGQ